MYKTYEEIKNMPRLTKSSIRLITTKNKSSHNLSYQTIPPGVYDAATIDYRNFTKSTNYSYCDFDNTDLRGCVFKGCNFTFAINMDKAIINSKTDFIQCNFMGVRKKELPMKEQKLHDQKCNVYPRGEDYTDKEIEEKLK